MKLTCFPSLFSIIRPLNFGYMLLWKSYFHPFFLVHTILRGESLINKDGQLSLNKTISSYYFWYVQCILTSEVDLVKECDNPNCQPTILEVARRLIEKRLVVQKACWSMLTLEHPNISWSHFECEFFWWPIDHNISLYCSVSLAL